MPPCWVSYHLTLQKHLFHYERTAEFCLLIETNRTSFYRTFSIIVLILILNAERIMSVKVSLLFYCNEILFLMWVNSCESPIVHIQWYMNYIYICYKLLIWANNYEGDYVCVAFTIIVGDTNAVVFTMIGSY